MRSLCERVRRRYCIPLPVEVRYDEFTRDILLNRLLKSAAHGLGRLRLGSQRARSAVAWPAESLRNVSLAAFLGNSVPEVNFDRPNEHHRGAATLAKLVLRFGYERPVGSWFVGTAPVGLTTSGTDGTTGSATA